MTTKTARGRIRTPGVVGLTFEAVVALEEGDPVHVVGPYQVTRADGSRPVVGICAVPNKGRVGSSFPAAVTPGQCTIDAFGFLVATVKAGLQIDAGEVVGVAPGGLWVPRGFGQTAGTNEVQTVAIIGAPTGGTFTLSFDGQVTAGIAFNATAAAVVAALEALNNINPGDLTATGGPLPGTGVAITFGGRHAGTDVPVLVANGAGLTGGTTPAVTVTTNTAGAAATANALGNGIALTTASGIDALVDVLCR